MPVGKSETNPLQKGHIQIGLNYHYSSRENLRSGRKIIANPFGQILRASIYSVELGYGINNHLTVFSTLPVLSVDFSEKNKNISDTKMGDGSIIFQYFKRYGTMIAPFWFSFGLGSNLPIGDGIRNPISSDKNFISGTVDPIFILSGLDTMEGHVGILGALYARPIFFKAKDKTRAGSFFSYVFGFTYYYSKADMDIFLQFRGLFRAKDVVGGKLFANSGGNWLYFVPGFQYTIGGNRIHGLQLIAELEIPIFQDVNGTQLTET